MATKKEDLINDDTLEKEASIENEAAVYDSKINELLERLNRLEAKNVEKTEAHDKEPAQMTEESKRLLTEKVPIRLRYDANKGDSVFVCVNGKAMQIKRGEQVEIPKAFDEVLQNAEKQDEAASRYIHRSSRTRELATE